MQYYDTVGKGIKTNRKRHKRYLAENEEDVKNQAAIDETDLLEIILVESSSDPREPPTERQLEYAHRLRLSFPSDVSKYEISNMIGAAEYGEYFSKAPRWILDFVWEDYPEGKGFAYTKYADLGKLIGYITGSYFYDSKKCNGQVFLEAI